MNTSNESEIAKLVVRGKSGIINNFKSIAAGNRNKRLIRTEEDSDTVRNLIKAHDLFNDRTKALGILSRPAAVQKYQKLSYRLIKIAVIHQGFVSKRTLARFKFNPSELVEKITYRNLIENFVRDNMFGEHHELIKTAIITEYHKGKHVDINSMSDEFHEINGELLQLVGSGELTAAEESEGWLIWSEIRNKDKTANYREQAKIENLCWFILGYDPLNPNLIIVNKTRLFSLSTSNLEIIISFICKQINQYNRKIIEDKRDADKRIKAIAKYIPKKPTSANQKKTLIKDLKAEGKTQSEIALLVGCSERTVRNYWK
jgi:hypothetical protein